MRPGHGRNQKGDDDMDDGTKSRAVRATQESGADRERPMTKPRDADILAAAPELSQHATVIRALGKRAVADIIEIGSRLIEAKKICGHGRWLPWLEAEFRWKEQTARNFISVAEAATKSPNFGDLNVPVSGLFLLARPDTPAEVIAEVEGRSQRGERLGVVQVRELVTRHTVIIAPGRIVSPAPSSTPPQRTVSLSLIPPASTTRSVQLDDEAAEALHLIIQMEAYVRSASEAKMAKLASVVAGLGRDREAIWRGAKTIIDALDANKARH